MIAGPCRPVTVTSLIEQHLMVARSVSARLKRRYPWLDEDELYGYGLFGLVSAANAWRPQRGKDFGAFAAVKAGYLAVDQMRRDGILRHRPRPSAPRRIRIVSYAEVDRTLRDGHWDRVLARLEARDMLETVLPRLANDDRRLLEMYYAQEMTLAEIAAVLGISEAAVCIRRQRLLAALRRQLSSRPRRASAREGRS